MRTLAWESASPNVGRNSLHSVSAVTVSAAKTAYPLLPSSSPNQSTGFDLEKENRGNGYGAGGPKPGCGMECARLDADCHRRRRSLVRNDILFLLCFFFSSTVLHDSSLKLFRTTRLASGFRYTKKNGTPKRVRRSFCVSGIEPASMASGF